jgi:hypothetical protein
MLKKQLEVELTQLGRKVEVQDGFLYSSGLHPVLLIAHMDTVHITQPTQFYIDKSKDPEGYLFASEGIGGDDRCGVYIIMEILKEIDCHVLFTEDEELGGLGAQKFTQSKIIPDVQFIVEFDRRGKDDAVFYECAGQDFKEFVEQYGFCYNFGSFSDISWVSPYMEIAAVNLSSGYYNAHTKNEYICISDVDSIIERALPLIRNVEQKFIHDRVDIFYCRWCGKKLDTQDDLDYEQQLCNKCYFDYIQEFPLAYEEYEKNEHDLFICSQCGDYLWNLQEMKVGCCECCQHEANVDLFHANYAYYS